MRQLAKQHGHKLLPTAETLGVALGLVVLDCPSELPRAKTVAKAASTHCILEAWLILSSLNVVLSENPL
jgi:hypothetical protein